MRVRILESADEDLRRGFAFYERQQAGVGSYFLSTLMTEIDSLAILAGVHSMCLGYYRMISNRFPFAVYYRVENDLVLVRAVLDCRQDPSEILKRLN